MRNMQETQVLRHSSSGQWLNFDETEVMADVSSRIYSEVGETKGSFENYQIKNVINYSNNRRRNGSK